MAPAMRATSRPAFELTSRRVGRRYEGIGRVFGGLALLASGGGPLLVSVIALVLAHVLGDDPSVRGFAFHALTLTAPGVVVGLGLSFVSALLTTTAVGWKGPVRVAADAAGLRFDSGAAERSIPLAEIRSGLVLSDLRVRVELRLRRGRVLEVHVAREEEGARLLAALGIGPTERRVAVPLGSVLRELVAGCFGLPAFMILWLVVIAALFEPLTGSSGPVVAWFALTVLSTWLLRRAVRRTQVVVGTDGVRVERPFSTVWLPYAEIDSVERRDDRLLLVRRGSDGPVVLRTGEALTETLAQRIRDAHEGFAGGTAPRGADALERRGRDLALWREDLRKLLAGDGYRAMGLTPEDALHTLDDANAPRDRRVGAALLLRVAGYPEAQEHIRVAAGTTADDALRAALASAAEDEIDDVALARALR